MSRAIWVGLCVALVAASSPNRTVAAETKTFPDRVLRGARAIVIAKMGKGFLNRHLSMDSTKSSYYPGRDNGVDRTYQPAHWTIMYRVRIPSQPSFEGWVHVPVDSTGSLTNTVAWRPGAVVDSTRPASLPEPIYGGCDCVHHPEECTFTIDESTAVEAAKRAGFAEGVKPWKVTFQWVAYDPAPCYHWVIENTLQLAADNCSGRGESLIISSSTGRVLTKMGWDSICCY
jgi:hypothetical protein